MGSCFLYLNNCPIFAFLGVACIVDDDKLWFGYDYYNNTCNNSNEYI